MVVYPDAHCNLGLYTNYSKGNIVFDDYQIKNYSDQITHYDKFEFYEGSNWCGPCSVL